MNNIISLKKKKNMISNICNGFERLLNKLQDIPLLLMRFSVGYLFMVTGWGKLHTLDKVASYFNSINIPFPELNALLVANIECWGGLLLILGLMTRLISIPLAVTMVVAVFVAHISDINSLKDLVNELPWNLLIILIALIFFGPGKISLDKIIKSKFCNK